TKSRTVLVFSADRENKSEHVAKKTIVVSGSA
ncbi:unnamed protein product, partial [marine sediment metagenome]